MAFMQSYKFNILPLLPLHAFLLPQLLTLYQIILLLIPHLHFPLLLLLLTLVLDVDDD